MRTQLAVALVTMLGVSLPGPLSAQREHWGGARPLPALPHEPMAREPGRPHGAVPYVRDGHWYGHAAPHDPRFHLAHPFAFGHFGFVGPSHGFAVHRFDLAARRIWLPGGRFEIATWDWPVTAPWCWTYVHAQFLGA